MKITKFIVFIGLLLVASMPLDAKTRRVGQKPVYMIGVGISLVDSMVFITDMMQVDSVTLEKKTNFLMDRQLYSFQLQHYLEQNYKGGPYVPSVFFGTKRKKMERQYLSLHKRYVNRKDLRMVLVDQGQFRFKTEEYVEQELVEIEKPKKKDKKKGWNGHVTIRLADIRWPSPLLMRETTKGSSLRLHHSDWKRSRMKWSSR